MEEPDDDVWVADLYTAVGMLEAHIEKAGGVPTITVPVNLLRVLADLGSQDIYTDADEYALRVDRMRDMITDLKDVLAVVENDAPGRCILCGTQCVPGELTQAVCPNPNCPEPQPAAGCARCGRTDTSIFTDGLCTFCHDRYTD